MDEERTVKGQMQDENQKCYCSRCGKIMSSNNFYSYKDGSKSQICKSCLTAHVDNFNPQTFEWILEKMDVPYIPAEWNVLRNKAFAKNPRKMNGMSVLGKYLAKMKLKQWSKYSYADTDLLVQEMNQRRKEEDEQKKRYEAQLKVKLNEGKISAAQYKTLVSTETQQEQLNETEWGNKVTGYMFGKSQPQSYEQALQMVGNSFVESNFMSEDQLNNPGDELTRDDKQYLALKWGRLYTPSQWVYLEKLYNQFMQSFDIQGAARIDTLKMVCKTSLKMNEAIDTGDIQGYQKLSRVYDSLMKSAKFTEAQNKDGDSQSIDSVSALVDFVQAKAGAVPKYDCSQPKDIVDKIILDLKAYTKSLIYEDKSLAQEIEKYLKDKQIAEEMKKDQKKAKKKGLTKVQLSDEDFIDFKTERNGMRIHDDQLNDQLIEEEYLKRRVRPQE